MKKTILIIAALLLLTGCKMDGLQHAQKASRIFITPVPIIESFDFEDHHYIVAYSSEGCAIIHAANCSCGHAK